MPVIENEVHPSTVLTWERGCKNRVIDEGFWAKNGVVLARFMGETVGVYAMKWIPHRMSTKCRYDQRYNDKRCDGCNVPYDEEHLNAQMKGSA